MRQVDVKLLEIMPRLHILLNKGDITFNYNNKRRRLSLLNVLRAAILDFMTSLRCRCCWAAEATSFPGSLSEKRETLVAAGHVPPRIWVVTKIRAQYSANAEKNLKNLKFC